MQGIIFLGWQDDRFEFASFENLSHSFWQENMHDNTYHIEEQNIFRIWTPNIFLINAISYGNN